MQAQKVVFFILLALLAESSCTFRTIVNNLSTFFAGENNNKEEYYKTKITPLGKVKINFPNSENPRLTIFGNNGNSNQHMEPILNLFLRTYIPDNKPWSNPSERIRTILNHLNPFGSKQINNQNESRGNRYPRQGENGPENSQNYFLHGTRNAWGIDIPNSENLNIGRYLNMEKIADSNTVPRFSNRFKLKGSHSVGSGINYNNGIHSQGFASPTNADLTRIVSNQNDPTIGLLSHNYNTGANFLNNGLTSSTGKTASILNPSVSNGGFKPMFLPPSQFLVPPAVKFESPLPLPYLVPPSLQSNNLYYDYNPSNYFDEDFGNNYQPDWNSWNANLNQDYRWSNEYDNPFNQPYPYFYQYAGWNHRSDSFDKKFEDNEKNANKYSETSNTDDDLKDNHYSENNLDNKANDAKDDEILDSSDGINISFKPSAEKNKEHRNNTNT